MYFKSTLTSKYVSHATWCYSTCIFCHRRRDTNKKRWQKTFVNLLFHRTGNWKQKIYREDLIKHINCLLFTLMAKTNEKATKEEQTEEKPFHFGKMSHTSNAFNWYWRKEMKMSILKFLLFSVSPTVASW